MRHTHYRGLTSEGKWIYGDLLTDTNATTIVTDGRDNGDHVYVKRGSNVIPDSVGQFTGLKDMNGREIYEGDIIDYKGLSEQQGERKTLLIVKWNNQDACFTFGGIRTDYASRFGEVIGNIHEDSELI